MLLDLIYTLYSSLIGDTFIFSAEGIKKSQIVLKYLPMILALELHSYL